MWLAPWRQRQFHKPSILNFSQFFSTFYDIAAVVPSQLTKKHFIALR